MSTATAKIRDRIRQLREKTVGRGCTEEEALSAAAKAAEMMARHGLSEEDLVMEEASSILTGQRHAALAKLWAVVAVVTNCSALTIGGARSTSVLFIGSAPGPEIAAYLRDILDRAVATELRAFKAGEFYRRRRSMKTKKAAIADFLNGLMLRLGDRLLALFEASMNEQLRISATEHRDRNYRSQRLALRDHKERFSSASNEGWRAGAKPNLSHGVGGDGRAPLQIGRS